MRPVLGLVLEDVVGRVVGRGVVVLERANAVEVVVRHRSQVLEDPAPNRAQALDVPSGRMRRWLMYLRAAMSLSVSKRPTSFYLVPYEITSCRPRSKTDPKSRR